MPPVPVREKPREGTPPSLLVVTLTPSPSHADKPISGSWKPRCLWELRNSPRLAAEASPWQLKPARAGWEETQAGGKARMTELKVPAPWEGPPSGPHTVLMCRLTCTQDPFLATSVEVWSILLLPLEQPWGPPSS